MNGMKRIKSAQLITALLSANLICILREALNLQLHDVLENPSVAWPQSSGSCSSGLEGCEVCPAA